MEFTLEVSDLHQNAQVLVEFHGKFTDFFRTSTRTVAPHALEYLKGQLLWVVTPFGIGNPDA